MTKVNSAFMKWNETAQIEKVQLFFSCQNWKKNFSRIERGVVLKDVYFLSGSWPRVWKGGRREGEALVRCVGNKLAWKWDGAGSIGSTGGSGCGGPRCRSLNRGRIPSKAVLKHWPIFRNLTIEEEEACCVRRFLMHVHRLSLSLFFSLSLSVFFSLTHTCTHIHARTHMPHHTVLAHTHARTHTCCREETRSRKTCH